MRVGGSLNWTILLWAAVLGLGSGLVAGPAGAQPFKNAYMARQYGDRPALLVERLGRGAFAPLQQKLAQAGPEEVDDLLEAVCLTRHPKLVGLLIERLRDPGTLDPRTRSRVRLLAVTELARYGDQPRVVRAIAALLNDPKAGRRERERAARVLARLAHPAAGEALIAFDRREGDSNTPLINRVAYALGVTPGEKVTAYLEQKLAKLRRAYMPWYGAIAMGAARSGRTALVEELIAAARRGVERSTVVPEVYRALGLLGDRRAVPVLSEAVVELTYNRRYWAAVALGRLGDERALDALQKAFDAENEGRKRSKLRDRAAIAWARARLGDTAGRAFLEELAAAEDLEQRGLALLFLLRLAEDDDAALAQARRIVELIRPYQDIGGCPKLRWEEIFEAIAAIERPEALALIIEVAGWKEADRAPTYARRRLERLDRKKRTELLLARVRQGGWQERNRAARELEGVAADPARRYRHLLQTGDLPARMIALRRLALFFPDRAAKALRAARRDPAWQVAYEAERLLAVRRGRPAFPQSGPQPPALPAAQIISYKLGMQPPDPTNLARDPRMVSNSRAFLGRWVRALVEDGAGRIWAATQYGLMRYAGMRWKRYGVEQGLCSQQVFDVALRDGRPLAATLDGLAVAQGDGFRCIRSELPLHRLAVADKKVFAGTPQGVVRLRSGGFAALDGADAPAGAIGALAAAPGGALWAALQPPGSEPDPDEMTPPLYRWQQGRWTAFRAPFVHYYGNLRAGVGHARGSVALRDLAVDGRGRLLLATSYGILRREGRAFRPLSCGRDYWPWYPASAVSVDGRGRVLAGYPSYVDVLEKGRWRRWTYHQAPEAHPMAVMGIPPVALLASAAGEIWLVPQRPFARPDNPVFSVLRRAVRDAKRLALPPETAVASLRAGAFWKQSRGDALERRFLGGKVVRVPANTVAITAVAKDPWDFEPVQYRFKVDEGQWTAWSDDNGMITPEILDEGVHRIQVQSRDASGHVDSSPAEVRFSVYTKDVTVIKIRDGEFQRIFPAQSPRYEKVGLGRVRLENTRDEPVEVDLELKIEDLFEQPATTRVKLAAGESRWVKVRAPFSDAVLTHEGRREVQAVVEARYSFEQVERSTRRSFPLQLLDANALVWDEPARLAAFINGRDPAVQKLAAGLYRTFAEQRPAQARRAHPLRNYLLALYTFAALDALGIQYKPDPDRPFASLQAGALDTVQFPSQTLARKTGDCDDLTVLFASLLENLNVPTAVLAVEGHVFLMFDSGVRVENRAAFPVDRRKTVERDGRLWVPLETTVLGRAERFEQAWSRGAENFHGKYRPADEQVVVVRRAWQQHPPATRPAEAAGPAAPALAGLQRAGEKVLADYGRQVQALAGAERGGGDPGALLERAAVLVKSGLFEDAAAAYRRALEGGDSFAGRYGLGSALAGRGRMLRALVEFQQALDLAAGPAEQFRARLAIAQCYKVNGNLNKARQHLEHALALNPSARHDRRYRALVRYLDSAAETKAAGDETPPHFQSILSGL
jgi:HEAT repeat protein/tetratricopeptide (TPR) repeat protein